MRFIIGLVLVALCAAAPVAAQEPRIGPAPDWVEQIAPGTADPALGDRPFQFLLSNSQSRYGTDRIEHYADLAFVIQNVQGLQALGNIVLPWQPEFAELIVHKVRILRNGTVIDLLANGHRFTVLRRESNLESAMLDGTLTAVMQAEGLAVGDVLEIAWTMRRHASALPLRGENFFNLGVTQPLRRISIRQIWTDAVPIRWRGTGAFERTALRRTGGAAELSIDLTDVQVTQPPSMVPARLLMPATLEVSQYRDWGEISAVLAPHYARAEQLAPDSPLRAEIARIAAASEDPRVRTLAALRLVEDRVRYFALVMGDGNYLPATADQSWERRYADCKGKTVLLLALLHGLGIDAEAVLVNSGLGDGLADRLPQMIAFNHIIVRARLGGRSYWLDGTRTGDRNLEDLASSTLGWGLPVRAAAGALERLPYQPPALPLAESIVTYDGSAGFGAPIPVRIEQIYRGDAAVQMRAGISQLGRDEYLRRMRTSLASSRGEDGEVTSVDVRDDDAAGTITVIALVRARMSWARVPGAASQRFRFSNETISWDADFDRPAGPLRDAPFALPVPAYSASTETIVLPHGGEGFSIEGRSFDRVVAGTRISRQVSIADGRAVARSEFRRIEREISAAAARGSVEAIRRIGNDQAYLHAAASVAVPGRGARGGGAARTASGRNAPAPATAREAVEQGYARLQGGDNEGAAADFARAATLAPNWSRPLANQALVLVRGGRYDEAEPLLARAAELDAGDFVIAQARGLIQLGRNRPVQAVVEFSRALELEPNDSFSLAGRSEAYQQAGELGDALADLDAILAREPADDAALEAKARIHAWRGEGDAAVAAADALLATDPGAPVMLYRRARILEQVGRGPAAAEAYRQALAALEARLAATPTEAEPLGALRIAILADSGETARAVAEIGALIERRPDDAATLLNERCWTRATANFELEQALADCEQAVARSPDNAAILDSRAFVKLRLGQIDGAIADASAALERAPELAASLYVRGVARLRKGERDAGARDLAAARRLVFDIDAVYGAYGVTP